MILFSSIAGFSFFITLLPFFIWNKGYFLMHGPFSIQSGYLPKTVICLAPLILFFLSLLFNKLRQILFFIAMFLFALVLTSFISHCIVFGIYNSIFGTAVFDISYFIFPLPFFILSISPRMAKLV